MKFMFNGHLFRFYENKISVVTQYGDMYRIDLTSEPDNPFIITPVKKYDSKILHDSFWFQKELEDQT